MVINSENRSVSPYFQQTFGDNFSWDNPQVVAELEDLAMWRLSDPKYEIAINETDELEVIIHVPIEEGHEEEQIYPIYKLRVAGKDYDRLMIDYFLEIGVINQQEAEAIFSDNEPHPEPADETQQIPDFGEDQLIRLRPPMPVQGEGAVTEEIVTAESFPEEEPEAEPVIIEAALIDRELTRRSIFRFEGNDRSVLNYLTWLGKLRDISENRSELHQIYDEDYGLGLTLMISTPKNVEMEANPLVWLIPMDQDEITDAVRIYLSGDKKIKA